MQVQDVKLRAGGYYIPARLIYTDNKRIEIEFRYNAALKDEIKCMKGVKWHGFDPAPRKIWSFEDCPRNRFQLRFLMGENPYVLYQQPLDLNKYRPRRKVMTHQHEMFAHMMQKKQVIIAGEMGTGKTLPMIEVMEHNPFEWFYFCPKVAIRAIELELQKWNSTANPQFYNYEKAVKLINNWPKDKAPPRGMVCDEASRLKHATSQRSQAIANLADFMRTYWNDDCFIIEASGSPAPKSPLDWWHLCEVARPGFLREGNIRSFTQRLAHLRQEQTTSGGVYFKITDWKTNPDLCDTCGQHKSTHNYQSEHPFVPTINEVEKLYRRMKGLVYVKLKKDCLDLPEKQYRSIILPPTPATLRLVDLIKAKSTRGITALMLLRELSDGFQYQDTQIGSKPCCTNPECDMCYGENNVPIFERSCIEIDTPKLEALTDLLEEHEDVGRLVVYAGFTASIDRIEKHISALGWDVIRVDGRGWYHPTIAEDPLKTFQSDDPRKIVFLGHPGSAGMGLTLTASPTIVYYSNDFNGESRIQSEDRIHRPGCKGANIIDLIHLPTDQLVLDNLKRKRKLQSITLGELNVA